MENNLNSGSIESLQPGQTLLVGARQVSNGKIQLEFAEKVSASDRPVSALSLLNASDSRFSSGARRSWTTAEPADASKTFGVDFSESNDKWYDSERGMQAAKRAGKDGDYITHNGDYIFSRTEMVLTKPDQKVEHTLLESDTQATQTPVNQGVTAEEVVKTEEEFIV